MTADELTRDVLDRCRARGFALAGVTDASPSRYADELRRWLDEGRHGEMGYLARHVEQRLDPRAMVPDARSVLVVADRYAGADADRSRPGHGRIARYARGGDYHVVIKRRLHALCDELAATHAGETFRVCVDTAPVLERELAQRAGLGAIGKHTLLIERGSGSYLLLGEVITTLALAPSKPAPDDPCGTCTRCIDACPTRAITPWSVDARACISYLTIEHRTAIDEQLHRSIGDWIFGCDVCQEVCPHNRPTERTRAAETHEAYAPRRDGFDLLEVLGWSEDARRAAFTRSALKRAKLAMMKRNALIVAGNCPTGALRERIAAVAGDPSEDEMVRETARAVMRRMGAEEGI